MNKDATPSDSQGKPIIERVDPSANVLALVEAQNRRQDDLRYAAERLQECKTDCQDKIGILRAEHAKELRLLDADRLEKIRQVDVLNADAAAASARGAIQTLATAGTATAETLRAIVASTADALSKQTEQRMGAINESVSNLGKALGESISNLGRTLGDRVAALELSAAQGKGKEAVSDPALAALVTEVRALANSSLNTTSKSEGGKAMWAYVVGGVMFLVALATLFTMFNK